MKVIKKGDKGLDVKTLQQKLKITPDGDFGPNTEKHVIRFQLMHGIVADGIVGSDTWSLILSLNDCSTVEIDEDNDTSKQYFKTPWNQIIHKYYLPKENT